jgi:hypothetical protein
MVGPKERLMIVNENEPGISGLLICTGLLDGRAGLYAVPAVATADILPDILLGVLFRGSVL